MPDFYIVGTGFVADLYMKSFGAYPDIQIAGAHDKNPDRLSAFSAHWSVPALESMEALFAAASPGDILLNLTNPDAHYDVSCAALEAGLHVYSEKPLAMNMKHAHDLATRAKAAGLEVTSAPCSGLSETAQTLWAAVRNKTAGEARLIYAEMDDDFIPQAPYKKWQSESGAPWPYVDEFEVGCTVEHAGYYLCWLLPIFGPVTKVVAASANLAPKEIPSEDSAADFSLGALFFESGVVARLTCSILAPHDHAIQVICDNGVLSVDECWNNDAPVKFRKRFVVRRRLMNAPFAKKLRLPKGETHPKLGRTGSASMNFALGPMELRSALIEGRAHRMPTDLALHMNEITLALQNAGEDAGSVSMTTTFAPVDPQPWAKALANG